MKKAIALLALASCLHGKAQTTSTPSICMVSTDSLTNYRYNIIYWDKTLYPNADSFLVYRYDAVSATYLHIGSVSKNSLSEWADTAFAIGGPNGGNPAYGAWKYKLAIRDTLGIISAKSPYHQSIFVQESGSNFSWTAYIDGGQLPTGYSFLRDDNNTGAWHVLTSVASTSTTTYFSPATNYTVTALPPAVCSADFNGDGNKDLAVANGSGGTSIVSVLLGTGTGTFGTATSFSVGAYPVSVISADFNNDGKVDLATTNSNSYDVSILLGNGTGGFGVATNYTVGTLPRSVTSADFNGDGKLDLATANQTSNDVSILLGIGTGTFGTATSFSVGAGTNPVSIVSADFNGDGFKDLATANDSSSFVSVFLGTGTGTFGTATSFSVGTNPVSIVSADFNGDTKFDLAVANNGSGNVSVLLGTGTGSFSTATNFSVAPIPVSIVSADFNGDGKLDLVTSNAGISNNVSVLLGTGTGTFGTATNFATGSGPWSVISADFNGDGFPDLATANHNSGNVSVLLDTVPTVTVNSTDPNYSSYPNANWRVDASGFNCNPTLRLAGNNSTDAARIKAHSNINNNRVQGISQISNLNSTISIYPNPASTHLTLTLSKGEGTYNVSMYDMLGNEVSPTLTLPKGEGIASLDVSGLAAGIYNVSIISHEGVINKRVVITK